MDTGKTGQSTPGNNDLKERPDFEKFIAGKSENQIDQAVYGFESVKQEVKEAFYFQGHMIHQNIDEVSKWVYERLQSENTLSRKKIADKQFEIDLMQSDLDHSRKRIEELEAALEDCVSLLEEVDKDFNCLTTISKQKIEHYKKS